MERRSLRAVGQLGLRLQQLGPVAGDVAQAQDRAAADGAALHVDEAVARAQRAVRRKASPRSLSCSRALSTAAASAGREPGAEGQRPLGRGALADDGGIALEARLAVAAVPAHEQLALGAHEQGGEVVRAAQGRELVPQGGAPARPTRRRSRSSSRAGGGREGDEAHEEAERDGVVQVEAVQEAEEIRGCLGEGQQQVVGERRPGTFRRAAAGRGQMRPEPRREGSPSSSALLTLPVARPCRAALPVVGGPTTGQVRAMPRPRLPTPQRSSVYA